MTWNRIKWLIGAKAVLLATALGGYYAFQGKPLVSRAVAIGESSPTPGAKGTAEPVKALPVIPKGEISVSEAYQIRQQLEMMRQDVENKISQLARAKASYDQAKIEVEGRLKRIEEERKLLEDTLQKEKNAKEERLGETIEFVSKMEPRKAAAVIEGMDRDLVLLLLRKLPPRLVTKILENATPKKASELMEYYTKIRSGREYELLKELGLCRPADGAIFWNLDPDSKKAATKTAGESTTVVAAAATPAVTATPGPDASPTASAETSPTPTPPAVPSPQPTQQPSPTASP